MKKGMSHLRNSKIRMLSQTHGITSTSDSQNQKSHIAVEKASSSNGKGEWRSYSAHFLLISLPIIRPTVTFAYKRQRKRWTACENCYMACDTILFVWRLIEKCFRWKFLNIFEDVRSLHICFSTNTLQLLGWIMPANVQDVFFAPSGNFLQSEIISD